MLRLIFLIVMLLWSQRGAAIVSATAHGGAVYSLFNKGDEGVLKGSGWSYGGSVDWQSGNSQKPGVFTLGINARQIRLTYQENSIEKRATYNTFGPSIGLFLTLNDIWAIQVKTIYQVVADLTTASSNEVLLNGETFRYSTWEHIKGPSAAEGRIALVHDTISGQFSRKNRFRTGMGLSFSQQAIKSVSTEVTVSRERLAPSKNSAEDKVSQSFAVIGLDLFLGITF